MTAARGSPPGRVNSAGMTAPFAPPPSRPMLAVLAATLLLVVAMPFGRREDWLGWAAFAAFIAANVLLWGVLTVRAAGAALDWRRDRHGGEKP